MARVDFGKLQQLSAGMSERQRLLALILVMTTVSMVSGGIGVGMLYMTAFREQQHRLQDVVRGRARLLEAVGRFHAEHGTHEAGAAATLTQVVNANRHFEGFGETGEFLLGMRDKDRIVFLLDHRHAPYSADSIPWDSELAEPMRLALQGRSGALVAHDHRGTWVLAAYAPVQELGWGMVAKIDMAEIQAPFVRSAILGAVVALSLVLLGATTFTRLLNPLIRRLQESEARTRAILEAAPDGIITIDGAGNIESFNAAASRLFGYEPPEVLGRHVTCLVPEEHHVGWTEGFRRHQVRETPSEQVTLEVTGLRANGARFPIQLSVGEPVHVGERSLYTGIFRDLTHRRLVEQRMEQAARLAAMGELSGNIAHEVNNPIGIVSAKARLLVSGGEELSPRVRTELDKIIAQCDRIAQLVRGLLSYCRPVQTPREPLSVNDPLQISLSFVESKAHRAGIKVERALANDLPRVEGNPQELEQVFLNLLLNAISAMPDGGVLQVVSRRDEDPSLGGPLVAVDVVDSGRGMDAETMARVFEPFFTTKGADGTGLGLSISHGLIAKHGGQIRVASQVGSGSTFTVLLPANRT